VLYTSNFKY